MPIDSISKQIEKCQEIYLLENRPSILTETAHKARRLDQFELAHDLLEKSIREAERTADNVNLARSLLELANVLVHYVPPGMTDADESRRQLCSKARTLFQELGDVEGEADCDLALSNSLDFLESLEHATRALKIATNYCKVRLVIRSLLRVGIISLADGDVSGAKTSLEEAMRKAELLDDELLLAWVHQTLALCGTWLPLSERRKLFELSCESFRKNGDFFAYSRGLLLCEICLGEHLSSSERLELLGAAVEVFEETRNEQLREASIRLMKDIDTCEQ